MSNASGRTQAAERLEVSSGLLEAEWPAEALASLQGDQLRCLRQLYLRECLPWDEVGPRARVVWYRTALGLCDTTDPPRARDYAARMWHRLRGLMQAPADRVLASSPGWQTVEDFFARPDMRVWDSESESPDPES